MCCDEQKLNAHRWSLASLLVFLQAIMEMLTSLLMTHQWASNFCLSQYLVGVHISVWKSSDTISSHRVLGWCKLGEGVLFFMEKKVSRANPRPEPTQSPRDTLQIDSDWVPPEHTILFQFFCLPAMGLCANRVVSRWDPYRTTIQIIVFNLNPISDYHQVISTSEETGITIHEQKITHWNLTKKYNWMTF